MKESPLIPLDHQRAPSPKLSEEKITKRLLGSRENHHRIRSSLRNHLGTGDAFRGPRLAHVNLKGSPQAYHDEQEITQMDDGKNL
ncbi:hypothetical protein EYF80_042211 [Liparis tanakae]|uniref:Uncharacterized protein n=1 Tax=Liparis tanakae TaxID=230148 RepID=A0A4Z2G227_9TELE|nr:hypothetical protein EYF80_042211 [Liparis tanakae]